MISYNNKYLETYKKIIDYQYTSISIIDKSMTINNK